MTTTHAFGSGPHILHVLTAVFDINSGPTVKHQYPSAIPGDQNLIAELMLPDQSHARKEDWTVFFLYHQRNSSSLEYHIKTIDNKLNATKLYVLNLVNTKFTKDVKRGAIVKAMCIVTPLPFFHVFKPLLMLSLDDYFKTQSVSALKNLYDAINSIDLFHIPIFDINERRILSARTESDIFIEKFEQADTQSMVSSLDSKNKTIGSPSSSHSSSSLSFQGASTLSSNTEHGNQAKSQVSHQLSPISTSSFSVSNHDLAPSSPAVNRSPNQTSYHVNDASFKETSRTSVSGASMFSNSSGDREREREREKPNYYIDLKSNGQRLITRNVTRDTHFYETRVNFNGMKIPVKVPTNVGPEEVGDFSMINLIQTMVRINQPFTILHKELTIYGPYTPPLLVLIYGLLTQKRILFVGLNNPSGEVSERVLAACYLASGGILRSFTTNAFPYTDLSKADEVMSCPGYIAGVKNPAFGHHKEWWDILIDLENNTMRISPSIHGGYSPDTNTIKEQGPEYTSSKMENAGSGSSGNGGDKEKEKTNAFFAKSLASITNPEDLDFMKKIKHMVEDHFAEVSVRTRCREYIKRLVRITTTYEDYKYGRNSFWPATQTGQSSNTSTNSRNGQEERQAVGPHVSVPGRGYVWNSDAQRAADFQTYGAVIEGWRRSRSYQSYVLDRRQEWPVWPRRAVDYEYYLDLLNTQSLGANASASVYSVLADNIQDYDDINLFLATAGSSSGFGSNSMEEKNLLHYVALGMLHPSSEIRDATVGLMWRIQNHSAGRHFFATLNSFFLITFNRLLPQFISQHGLAYPSVAFGPKKHTPAPAANHTQTQHRPHHKPSINSRPAQLPVFDSTSSSSSSSFCSSTDGSNPLSSQHPSQANVSQFKYPNNASSNNERTEDYGVPL